MSTRLVSIFPALGKATMQVVETVDQPTFAIMKSDPDSSHSSTQLPGTPKQPTLTEMQHSMIHSLNKLPNVREYSVPTFSTKFACYLSGSAI